MAEKSGFFNARETEEGTYDREYDAEQFAEYFANFISNGVYANPANQLKVVFDDSSSKPFVVIVRKGKAYIDGYWYELTEDMEIAIPANTKSYAIKDVICCTLDKTERKVSIILKEDVISDYPTNDNTQHDLVLSTLLVQPNASKLNAGDITDKRPDKTYCGFVTGVIDQIDTAELFQQYDDAFQTWFNEMKNQLSTDAAGNLQTQIGLLSSLKTKVKDSIVNAINSLYDSTIGKTLKTLDEVSSNTEQGLYVDALVIAELNRKIPVHSVLYESENGTNSGASLNELVSNYDYIEVFYGNDISSNDIFPQNYVKVPVRSDGTAQARPMFIGGSSSDVTIEQLSRVTLKFSGNQMTMTSEKFVNFSNTSGAVKWVTATTKHMKIFKVVGWKYFV